MKTINTTKVWVIITGLFFFVILSSNLRAQIITTVAGNGTIGYTGDFGPATAAEIDGPHAVLVDPVGNLYIGDFFNFVIRKVDVSGTITTFAGNGMAGYAGDGGPAIYAELSDPWSLAMDKIGNLYFSDGGTRIRKIDTAGIITTVAGTYTTGFSGDGGPATSAKLNGALGIAVDTIGNLYIADTWNNCIRKVNTSGIISTIAGNPSAGFSGDGGPATAARFYNPFNLTVDKWGNIYIMDNNNNRVRKINTSGIISTFAGNGTSGFSGDGGPATSAEFYQPSGIAADAVGNVYIGDGYNQRIRKVNSSGIITTIAGNGTQGYSGDGGLATLAEINDSWGLALDGAGNLYISDQDNNCVRKVSPITTGIEVYNNSKKVNLYPVPCRELVTADLNGNGFTGIRILDVLGREVYTQAISEKQQDLKLQVNLGDFSNGIYTMEITTLQGNINKRIEVRK